LARLRAPVRKDGWGWELSALMKRSATTHIVRVVAMQRVSRPKVRLRALALEAGWRLKPVVHVWTKTNVAKGQTIVTSLPSVPTQRDRLRVLAVMAGRVTEFTVSI
jgi:hypothetical protein